MNTRLILITIFINVQMLLTANTALAQDSMTINFFPYQIGDELVYQVYYPDFPEPEWQDDYKLTITRDSIGEDGTRFLSLENEGFFPPIATGFMVDTLGNVYATKWWEFPEYWKVLDTSKSLNEPWIAIQYSWGYELGNIQEAYSDETFGIPSEVFVIDIYSSEDSLATWGYTRNSAWWKSEIGIVQKFSSEGGPVYVLKGALINGTMYGDTTAIITSIEPVPTLPENFILYQNYPNPFNPFTTITYSMNKPGLVKVELYTIHGQLVRELINEYKIDGTYDLKLDGSRLSSGVYVLRGQVGTQTEFMTITLIK